MEKCYQELVQGLDNKINELTMELENPIFLAQELIETLINSMNVLKKNVLKQGSALPFL